MISLFKITRKKLNRLSTLLAAVGLSLFIAFPARADQHEPKCDLFCELFTSGKVNIGDQVQTIYNIGFGIAVGLALIMTIIGGLRYTSAGGNASEAGEAKTMIKEALIGLGIALLAASLTNFLVGA